MHYRLVLLISPIFVNIFFSPEGLANMANSGGEEGNMKENLRRVILFAVTVTTGW